MRAAWQVLIFRLRRLSPMCLGNSARAKDADRSDLLDLFSTYSRHLFRGDEAMATAVFGGAFLLASVIFREPGRARRLTGQSPLPKTRMCNASYSRSYRISFSRT
jgi:hypothetical protein